MTKVYLDTNLWNELCDQDADPELLLSVLAAKNVSLVLSHQTVYELARCFRNDGIRSERGRILFAYLRQFMRRNLCCITEVTEVLAAEMRALLQPVSVDAFLPAEDYLVLAHQVEKLAGGNFRDEARVFVEDREALARRNRSGPGDQLGRLPALKQRLKSITPEQLAAWLQAETVVCGADLLAGQISRRFAEATERDALEWARGLLASPDCRLAKALVRADLYFNWRYANGGSTPRDLFDDIYHIMNAIYCDVYATKELGHEKYAALLLTKNTTVAIYLGQTPLSEWIEALR